MPIKPEVIQNLAVHGHRGSRGTHPENTIPAFVEAVSAGAHVLELDLQLTADNVPVVFHDAEISGRLCQYKSGATITIPLPIRLFAAAELAQFECGTIEQARFPQQKQISGVEIPTFETFLNWWSKWAPRYEINVETKMTASDPKNIPDPALFVAQIVKLLRQYGAVEKTILQSFDYRTLVEAKKVEPALRLSCLVEQDEEFCKAASAIGAQFVSPSQELVNATEVAKCHLKGIQVVPWTANNPKEWDKLMLDGVDAIITDYPRRLVHHLQKLRLLGGRK